MKQSHQMVWDHLKLGHKIFTSPTSKKIHIYESGEYHLTIDCKVLEEMVQDGFLVATREGVKVHYTRKSNLKVVTGDTV